MKRLMVLTVLVALVLCTGAALAGVGGGEVHVVVTNPDVVTTNTDVHRYVSGLTMRQFYPNFYANDWDGYSKGQAFKNLSQAEQDYLKTITNLSIGVRYYIDLGSQTISTQEFQDVNGEKVLDRVEESLTYSIDPLDPLTIIVTHYITAYYTVNNVDYQLIVSVYDSSPLVLDIDNNNTIDVARNNWKKHAPKFYTDYQKMFDITGDGAADVTEWMAPRLKDALLVVPENGKVENALQLFGTAGGYRDGYEKLAFLCDKDNNGWAEGAELKGLMLWIDQNNDALCQDSELKQLSDYNVARISVNHKDYVSTYETTDGNTHMMWDWWPAVYEARAFRR